MENEQLANKKTNKKKAIIQYSLILLVAVGLGVTGGIIVKKNTGQSETDYSGFDPELYREDSVALLKQYEANPRKSFTPAELVNIGLQKYRNCENSYSIGIGTATTIVNQTIRNAQIKNGNQYFEESISNSSMVHIANRVNQIGIDKGIDFYKGKATGTEDCKYTDNKVSYASDDYKKEWGKTLDEMFIYLISNKTVLDEGTSVEKKDNLIKIKLNLNVDTSSYYYKVQMKTISKLSALPTFEYLKQTYTFSSDMTLLHCSVDEQYQASMSGIKANIHNTIEYYYHANEIRQIPSLNEMVNYSTEGETIYE